MLGLTRSISSIVKKKIIFREIELINLYLDYDVKSYGGKKYIILSTIGPFGGKNQFLSVSYFTVGGICLLVSLFFLFKMIQAKKQKQN